jgi:hypothetical protein
VDTLVHNWSWDAMMHLQLEVAHIGVGAAGSADNDTRGETGGLKLTTKTPETR